MFNGLQRLLGRTGTAPNSPLGGLSKLTGQEFPTSQGPVRSIQTAANNLLSKTGNIYGLSPDFNRQLENTNPMIQGKGLDAFSALLSGKAAGLYHPGDNRIELGQSQGLMPDADTLVHEGLHSTWQNNPNIRAQFSQAYRQSITPQLINYLNRRLDAYSGYRGLNTLNNFDTLTPDIQTEVHSFIPAYYAGNEGTEQMSPSLSNYYSKYFNPAQPAQYNGVRDSIMRAAGLYKKYFPGYNQGEDRGA